MVNKNRLSNTLKEHKATKKGLLQSEAEKRIKEFGYNELEEKKKITPLKVFLRQFTNFIVFVLIIASLISFFIGEIINFWVIISIIGFVIILGFIQEYKAERAMEALKKIMNPAAKVLRNNHLKK